ncbi:MAG TPA: FHA domain-containing protein [Anaerolineales bacterium]|nr:FHA domain-containing protein [Anaerolineales bacterium]
MDDYIDVKIDVFEHTGQRARLRKSLTVNDLIAEILREFDDIAADSPEKYAIYLKGFDHPLKQAETLAQLDIQPQDELVFEYVRQTIRRMLEVQQYAILREDSTGKEFDIQWQPAVIGRPSTDVDHNIILAVNVQLLPDGKTISRRHAQITFSEGRYFIEPLAEQNPVFLNGKELPVQAKREIRNGDKLAFGNNRLMMTFSTRSQRDARSVAREPLSQPVSPPASTPVASRPVQQPAAPAMDPNATNFVSQTLPTLTIEASSSPAKVGEQIELVAFPFILGRSLPSLSAENEVSRRHAEITFDVQKNSYSLTDLRSTNGVTINGQRIPPDVPHTISPGMRIGLGSTLVVRFEA